jgi:hypothetical protein
VEFTAVRRALSLLQDLKLPREEHIEGNGNTHSNIQSIKSKLYVERKWKEKRKIKKTRQEERETNNVKKKQRR